MKPTKLESLAEEKLEEGYDVDSWDDNLTPEVRAELIAAFIDDLGVTDNIDFIGQSQEVFIAGMLCDLQGSFYAKAGDKAVLMNRSVQGWEERVAQSISGMMQTYAEPFIEDAFEWARDRQMERDRDDVYENEDLQRRGKLNRLEEVDRS